jgi:ubiquinone/menaquinone biosynthesis C-methylase UbiE
MDKQGIGLNQTYDRSGSKVEVEGFEARHYDLLMSLITADTYPFFIRRVVRDMAIQPRDAILDLGSGSGRNACLMARHHPDQGRIVGLGIGEEVLAQDRRAASRLGLQRV